MQSGVGKLSCNKTALKRCTSTETLWNRKAPCLSSPEDEEIFLPKLPKSWHADVFKGPIIIIIMTAAYACGARLCNGRVSVRLSVCLSRRSTAAAACGGVCCWAPSRQEISIDSCRRTQQQLRRSTALSSQRGQCHVDNRGTRLNLLLLHCSAFQRSELFVSSSFRDLIYKAFTVISTGNL